MDYSMIKKQAWKYHEHHIIFHLYKRHDYRMKYLAASKENPKKESNQQNENDPRKPSG